MKNSSIMMISFIISTLLLSSGFVLSAIGMNNNKNQILFSGEVISEDINNLFDGVKEDDIIIHKKGMYYSGLTFIFLGLVGYLFITILAAKDLLTKMIYGYTLIYN